MSQVLRFSGARVLKFGAILATFFVGSIPVSVAQQQPTFRARTDVVLVPVSVMQGREPVTGLKAADFELTDNGVRQTVDEVTSDRVPIDVTLVLTGRSADRNVEHSLSLVSSEATRKLLQPADRLRMVWITDEVAGSVVHMLEIVDVDDHQHRHLARRIGAAPLEIGRYLLGEVSAVGEARQCVVMRHEIYALFGADALGDIFE